MKKVIYFGLEKDFWWHTRFKEFIEGLDFMESLVKNDFSLMESSLNLPLIYYSEKYDTVLRYKRESFCEDANSINSYTLRAKITLFGDERNIEDLEWLIKGEAKRYKGVDNVNDIIH